MNQNITDQVCDKCHELLAECLCEEPQLHNWQDKAEPNNDLLGKFQKGDKPL